MAYNRRRSNNGLERLFSPSGAGRESQMGMGDSFKESIWDRVKGWANSQEGTDRSDAGGRGYGPDAGPRVYTQFDNSLLARLGMAPERPSLPVESENNYPTEDMNIEESDFSEFGEWGSPSDNNAAMGFDPNIDYSSDSEEYEDRDYQEGEERFWNEEDQDYSGYEGPRYTNPAMQANRGFGREQGFQNPPSRAQNLLSQFLNSQRFNKRLR